MLRDGQSFFLHIGVDIFDAIPSYEWTPDLVGPGAFAWRETRFTHTISRQTARLAVGRMSIEFFVNRIDLGRLNVSHKLNQFLPDCLYIDLVRRVRLFAEDHVLHAQDLRCPQCLSPPHFSHSL